MSWVDVLSLDTERTIVSVRRLLHFALKTRGLLHPPIAVAIEQLESQSSGLRDLGDLAGTSRVYRCEFLDNDHLTERFD